VRRVPGVEAHDLVGDLDEPSQGHESARDHERELCARVARADESQGRKREQQIPERAGEHHDDALN
jgi:hypothetical protein